VSTALRPNLIEEENRHGKMVDDSRVGGEGGVVGLDHPYKKIRLSSKGDRYYSVLVFF
jgi:hypothetical protein